MDESCLLLVFLSKGYFSSRACQREVERAVQTDHTLLPVRETAEIHGGGPLADFERHCPENLRSAVFGSEHPCIAWHRPKEFRLESLQRIAGMRVW